MKVIALLTDYQGERFVGFPALLTLSAYSEPISRHFLLKLTSMPSIFPASAAENEIPIIR
jgi:hypothetical protein